MPQVNRFLLYGLAVVIFLGLMGCGGPPMQGPEEVATPVPPPVSPGYPDQVILKEALQGKTLPAGEVADLSDRLLTEGNSSFQDGETMARLELLLLKTLKEENQQYRAKLLRNLGIIHFHQKQYKRARQELQASNELNPRDARTHYYLARLFAQQGETYQKKGRAR